MSRVVIFAPCGPLYLNRVTRDSDGRVKTGHVVNGRWNFEIRKGEQLAKDHSKIVNRWPDEPSEEVVVSDKFGDDYNAAIAWAEKHRKKAS